MADTEHTLQDIVLLEDLLKLPKDILKEICTELNLPSEGLADELTRIIWEKINNNKTSMNLVLEPYKNRLFCGKSPSLSWFKVIENNTQKQLTLIDNESKDLSIKKIIIKNLGYNPFEHIQIPDESQLTTTPTVISAANISDDEYFFRFMYKIRNTQAFYANKITTYPKNKIITVLVNEKNKILEIRGDFNSVNKISSYIATTLLGNYLSLEKINLSKKFNNNVDCIARCLDGQITSTSSVANGDLNLTIEESNTLLEIFTRLNSFFNNNIETDELIAYLENIKSQNEILFSNTNFETLLLTGLKNLGLATNNETDLKEQPLYTAVKPFVIDRIGSVLFNVMINNMSEEYTAHIAFNKNSIYFQGWITEEVICKIREELIYS